MSVILITIHLAVLMFLIKGSSSTKPPKLMDLAIVGMVLTTVRSVLFGVDR